MYPNDLVKWLKYSFLGRRNSSATSSLLHLVRLCSRSHSLTYFFPKSVLFRCSCFQSCRRHLAISRTSPQSGRLSCVNSSVWEVQLKDLIIKHSGNCALRCWNKFSRLHCSVTNQKNQTFNSNFKVGPYQLQAGFVTPLIGVMTPLTHL